MNKRANKFRNAALLLAFAAAPSQSATAGTSAPLAVMGLSGFEVLISAAITVMFCSIPIILFIIQLCSRQQREKMLHETIRSMVEKGVPIPPELFAKAGGGADLGMRLGRHNDLRNGILMLGIGFGTVIAGYTIGWIVVFLGLAFVVASMFEKKDRNDGQPPKV